MPCSPSTLKAALPKSAERVAGQQALIETRLTAMADPLPLPHALDQIVATEKAARSREEERAALAKAAIDGGPLVSMMASTSSTASAGRPWDDAMREEGSGLGGFGGDTSGVAPFAPPRGQPSRARPHTAAYPPPCLETPYPLFRR